MAPIGIIGAMEVEVELLVGALENHTAETVGEYTFHSGILDGRAVVIVRCGVGKVRAAMCVQALADRFDVAAVVNTGIAGGLAANLHIGDIVLCTDAVQHDFDVSAFGYVPGYMCTGGDGQTPTRFHADDRLRETFRTAAVTADCRVTEGVIASGDVFVSRTELKEQIVRRFGAAAAEMEGAAVAQTAGANRIPFMVIRMISDLADGSAPDVYQEFEDNASAKLAEVVRSAVARICL